MAIVAPTTGTLSTGEWPLGTISTATTSGHADITGYVSRVYVSINNGAANSCVFGVDGSHDGTNFFDIAWRRSAGTYATTDCTTTAATKECIFLPGTDIPRYIRVNVTTHNTNGTVFTLFAER